MKAKKIVIKKEDIRVRKDWGILNPCSLRFKDKKKELLRKICRHRVML